MLSLPHAQKNYMLLQVRFDLYPRDRFVNVGCTIDWENSYSRVFGNLTGVGSKGAASCPEPVS
jgi:hypothetical protein